MSYGVKMDIVEHGSTHGTGSDGEDAGPESAAALLAELDALALQAAWLDLMIQWEREHDQARGETQPLYGVRTPMNTKTKADRTPRAVSVSLASTA